MPEAKYKCVEKATEAKRAIRKETNKLFEKDQEWLSLVEVESRFAAKVEETLIFLVCTKLERFKVELWLCYEGRGK
jgi:hypothetical protein